MELSISPALKPREAAKGRGHIEARARDCLESPNAIVRSLPVAHPQRQEAGRRRHSDCPRAIGLHLGDQSRGHSSSTGVNIIGRLDCSTQNLRFRAGQPRSRGDETAARCQSCSSEGGAAAGNSRWTLCGRSSDRRPTLDRDSPRRTNGNAVSNPRIRACSPTSSGPFSSARSIA
jgi:hypothetical protein